MRRQARAGHLWKSYRLRLEEYKAAVRRQKGRCAICGRNAKLVVDHPNGVKLVRGLLCNSCNAVLGFADEDCRILRRAIKYLIEWDKLMPVQRVQKNGKPGYRYGATGKVYTYTPGNKASRETALKKAIKQALAIQYRTGKPAHL